MPVAEHKTEGPVTSVTFLGIIVGTVLQLPTDKLARLQVMVRQWLDCTRHELEATWHMLLLSFVQATSPSALCLLLLPLLPNSILFTSICWCELICIGGSTSSNLGMAIHSFLLLYLWCMYTQMLLVHLDVVHLSSLMFVSNCSGHQPA